ncbi:DUF2752 domain-containing protein [Flavobacterium silvaticum]|uniref:DUF2752 domain-containing protein n=1 Tax=Flavobacterium silvaticum TaxID=1852020 RepID=A0A972JEV0_9FLAO|nr:DUF2752 domain-containing protein [Flavobacterium silvaticum]NMH27284.1 DUF2752 domain-containing protein [Flavobacterium silvaticum]
MEKYMLPCFLKSIFGIDCPGCGAQRSVVLLFKGEFIAAFHMFPAIYTTILFAIFVSLHFIDKSHNYLKGVLYLGVANAVIMMIAYIYKMIFFT